MLKVIHSKSFQAAVKASLRLLTALLLIKILRMQMEIKAIKCTHYNFAVCRVIPECCSATLTLFCSALTLLKYGDGWRIIPCMSPQKEDNVMPTHGWKMWPPNLCWTGVTAFWSQPDIKHINSSRKASFKVTVVWLTPVQQSVLLYLLIGHTSSRQNGLNFQMVERETLSTLGSVPAPSF